MSKYILTAPAPKPDFRVNYGPDPLNFFDVRTPKTSGPHPVLTVIHGGFWQAMYDLTHIGHLCAAFTSLGVTTINVEYRRIGNSGGGWPGTLHDVGLAADRLADFASRFSLDLDRLVVIGHSAGGHLALWLAARHKLKKETALFKESPRRFGSAVSLAGVADLRQAWELRLGNGIVKRFLGGTPEEFPIRYDTASPAALLPTGTRHVLVHGRNDESVPFAVSQYYQTRAVSLGDEVRLVPLDNTGHFELIDPKSEQWPRVVKVVLPLLGL